MTKPVILLIGCMLFVSQSIAGRSESLKVVHIDKSNFLKDDILASHPQQKPDCSDRYPPPDDYPNWTHCKPNGGGSACGGPQQCACDESQRLITFTCDQGSYQQCWAEKGNGCPGQ